METKEQENMRFYVKKWIQGSKICRHCGTLMNIVAGGIYGAYNPSGVNNSFNTHKCPKCDLYVKEIKKIEWAQNGNFKNLITQK